MEVYQARMSLLANCSRYGYSCALSPLTSVYIFRLDTTTTLKTFERAASKKSLQLLDHSVTGSTLKFSGLKTVQLFLGI